MTTIEFLDKHFVALFILVVICATELAYAIRRR